jgi:beta-lactamase class A
MDALDLDLAGYLNNLGRRIGVDVLDVTRGVEYTYNADLSFYAASSMKVPIMLALLGQLNARHREPTAEQISLMTAMIENSSNDAATELYKEIGWQRGMRQFMESVAIGGLYAEVPTIGWGHSTITPATMVALLAGLHNNTILTDDDRAFALRLMRHIESDQRVGVGDSSPAGATIEMKDGWTSAADEAGPYVMNSSGIVTLGGETYIIAVYTSGNQSYPEAFDIARHVCKVVGEKLMGPVSAG